MPPTRRKSSQQAQAQQTLSFGARSNKITKPSLPASKSLTKPSPLAKAAVDEISTPSHTTDEEGENTLLHVKEEPPLSPGGKLAIREQKKIEKPARSEIEVKAEKLSEDELRKYWRAEEQSRKARRGTLF